MWSTPADANFFLINRLVSLREMKGSLVWLLLFYSIYTGRIQGFFLHHLSHLVETTHFFLKSCRKVVKQN